MNVLIAKRVALGAVVLAIAAAIVLATVAVAAGGHESHSTARGPARVATTTVVKTDLSDSQVLPGVLGFGAQTPVIGRGTGVITKLPVPGRITTRGKSLYRVDDQPVPVFFGDTPLFRTLHKPTVKKTGVTTGKNADSPASPPASPPAATPPASPPSAPPITPPPTTKPTPPQQGRDVSVVAENLRALGYHVGYQPSGRGRYTATLATAVKHWQHDVGMKATGTLRVGQVVVLPGAARIDSVQAQLGDDAAEPVLTVTSTTKTITVSIDPSAINGIQAGSRVSIALPDSRQIPGQVASISQKVKSGAPDGPSGQNSTPTLTLNVHPTHPSDLKKLDSADVQVTFKSGLHQGVLAVPVSALLALRGGGFALQRPDGTLVAVETGLFADGLVEVSGSGMTAGMRVQTAS